MCSTAAVTSLVSKDMSLLCSYAAEYGLDYLCRPCRTSTHPFPYLTLSPELRTLFPIAGSCECSCRGRVRHRFLVMHSGKVLCRVRRHYDSGISTSLPPTSHSALSPPESCQPIQHMMTSGAKRYHVAYMVSRSSGVLHDFVANPLQSIAKFELPANLMVSAINLVQLEPVFDPPVKLTAAEGKYTTPSKY